MGLTFVSAAGSEEDTLGVFLLGRVKSGQTLGNGCSSTKSLLGS